MASDEGLQGAILAAHQRATILDDMCVVDNDLVYKWLGDHEIRPKHYDHLVIGEDLLPLEWKPQTLKFLNQEDALHFVRNIKPGDLASLQCRLSLSQCLTLKAFQDQLAASLVSGSIWAIRPKRIANANVRKTSATVFDALNPKLGTKIDFKEIAKSEGNQRLRGYVPFGNNGIVIENSGMTVATGFDVGQWSEAQLDDMGFADDLADKLRPFVAHPFKGKSRSEVAKAVAGMGPVPEITSTEADLCDGVVFETILESAKDRWNNHKAAAVPTFTAMPAAWQTVWFSRFYQEGAGPKTADAKAFRKAALAGEWTTAVDELKGYSHFTTRATSEAKLLAASMPAELPKPKTATTPADSTTSTVPKAIAPATTKPK